MKNVLLFIMLCIAQIGFAQIKVQSDGKIGIGTTTPGRSIDIKSTGDLMLWDTIRFGRSGTSTHEIQMVFSPASESHSGPGPYYGTVYLYTSKGYPFSAVLGHSDHRWGHIYLMNSPDILSDEKVKENIKDLPERGILDKIIQIRPVTYNFKDSLTGMFGVEEKKQQIGFIAQELEKIFPDIVSYDVESDSYGVRYASLIPYLVQAIKEQQEQIKQLVKLIDIKSINEKAFEENGIESIPLLLQNTPNPFNQATEIGYFIPETVNSANIYIYDINGFQQRNISISERGKGATTLQASALQAGIYFYTLICDGKPVDTKQMILTR